MTASSLAFTALGVVLLATAWAAPTKSGNMNGKYVVASVDKLHVPWNDDYASKGHEYFDVWAPEIATHYGEVFWTSQGNQPLPQHIVDRFKGKVMAITGYEQDQVMVVPTGKPGLNPEQDVSVPINWAYNHHYMAWMTGAHSELVEAPCEPGEPHCQDTKLVAVDKKSDMPRNFGDVAPTSQMFSEGNGGESRKSFHGYPDGFAQLIESPETWTITPMQIDTRNRNCGSTYKDVGNCTHMIPDYEPRSARYGKNWQGVDKPALASNYSGILECPCNSRYGGDPLFYPDAGTKQITHNYEAIPSGSCQPTQDIISPKECFSVVASNLGISASDFVNLSVSDPTLPSGCSVVSQANGTATVYYNSADSKQACTHTTSRVGQATSQVGVTLKVELDSNGASKTDMSRSPKGQWCSDNRNNVIQSFHAKSSAQTDMEAALKQCEAFCLSNTQCNFCSVDALNVPKMDVQFSAIPECGNINSWGGALIGDISSKSKVSDGNATITLSGPADVWFGVGLDAENMADSPYTLIVNASGVIEQKIGTCGSEAEHCPGDQLESSVKVVSNTVASGVRTVVMTRGFQGATDK